MESQYVKGLYELPVSSHGELGMGQNHHAVRCLECEQVYSARLHDGDVIRPTETGVCKCGTTQVVDLTVEKVRNVRATAVDRAGKEDEYVE